MTHTKPRTITLRLTPFADLALAKLIESAKAKFQTINQSDVLNQIIIDAADKLDTAEQTVKEQTK